MKKPLSNKIFRTSFVIKKSYLNFSGKTLPFSKRPSKMPRKQLFAIFSENTAFFKKTVERKNIQHLISGKRGHIYFWCKTTPYRLQSDRAALLQTKYGLKGAKIFTSTFRNIALLTHFVRQRFLHFVSLLFYDLVLGFTKCHTR